VSKVEQAISAHHLFEPHQFVLVAVSGGLDSMVLLHVLHRLADKYGWMPAVAHFNHQLRGTCSDRDAEFVKQTTARRGLKFVSDSADVKQFARKQKLSIEMAGRQLRHDFLARAASMLGIRTIALAHHADDQVELFFLRLLRGTGGEGLTGMRWTNPSPSNANVQLARPFLHVRRQELEDYAKREGIEFRPDATNAQLQIERNRIRHELLPMLRQKFQPALVTTTLRLMEIIGAQSDCIKQTARHWEHRQNDLPFDQLHVAVQRQWMRLELLRLNIAPEFDLIEKLRCRPGQVVMVNPKLGIWRNAKGNLQSRLALSTTFNTERSLLDVSPRDGRTVFGGLVISWKLEERQTPPRVLEPISECEYFDAAKVGPSIVLRHWQRGDRYQPIGMAAPVKLQDIFTNQKIARERRHQVVVATTSLGEIFWVEGLRISARFKVSDDTVRRLKWTWRRD